MPSAGGLWVLLVPAVVALPQGGHSQSGRWCNNEAILLQLAHQFDSKQFATIKDKSRHILQRVNGEYDTQSWGELNGSESVKLDSSIGKPVADVASTRPKAPKGNRVKVSRVGKAIGPVAGAILAGVLHTILAPDHLCTIVTLSAFQGSKAFWFGVRWATGHMLGMCVIGCISKVISSLCSTHGWEVYEHCADYVVGISLVLFGFYFLLNAVNYFDDDWAPQKPTCECHKHLFEEESPGHGHGDGHGERSHSHIDGEESKPSNGSSGPGKITAQQNGAREAGSVLVGFLQGLACPSALVGIVFLKRYHPIEIAIFMCIFFIVTTVAMGILSMCYGMLTQRCFSTANLARGVFYASCALSIMLGICFIVLNANGTLDSYLGHDHGGDDHGHVYFRFSAKPQV